MDLESRMPIEVEGRSCCRLKSNLHHRSIKTVFCALLLFIHLGFLYNFPLFFEKLREDFKSNAALTGSVGSITYGIFTFGTIFTTWFLRHLSHRKIGIIGITMGSVSLIACSFSPTIIYVIITYGVFFGMSTNMSLVVVNDLVVILFQDRWRSRALTLLGIGSAVGSLSMSNLVEYVLTAVGWRWTFRIFAPNIFILGIICCMFLSSTMNNKDNKRLENTKEFGTRSSILFLPDVWLFSLTVLSSCTAMAFQYVIMGSFFDSIGLLNQKSATGMTSLASGDVSAKIIFFFIAPYISFPFAYCLIIGFLMAAILSATLTWISNTVVIFILSFCYGFSRGVYNALHITVSLEVFDSSRGKTAQNVVYFWNGIGNIVGPFLFGCLFDIYNSYYSALYVCAGLYILSSGSMLLTVFWQKYCAPERYMVDYRLQKDENKSTNEDNLTVEIEQMISVV